MALSKDWKEKILAMGIAIVFVSFIAYSIDAFFDSMTGSPTDLIEFILTISCGLIAIVIGKFVKARVASIGLMGGGLLVVIYGVISYWDHFGKLTISLILGSVLLILIWFGLRTVNKSSKKRK